jgi:hypothetical protein
MHQGKTVTNVGQGRVPQPFSMGKGFALGREAGDHGLALRAFTEALFFVPFAVSIVLLGTIAFLSLAWPRVQDAANIAYIGRAWTVHGLVPYRDMFDFQVVGSYLSSALLARIFGYTDLGFRLADLAVLSLLLVTTGFWLRGFGAKVALFAPVLFGLLYFEKGPFMSMQRDYVMVVPIALALAVASLDRWSPAAWKCLAIGCCFGICALFKPTSLIALPVILVGTQLLGAWRPARPPWRLVLGYMALTSVGVGLPVGAALLYLFSQGALGEALDIIVGYWPLYGAMTGDKRILSGGDQLRYLLSGFTQLGGHRLWLVPATLGLLVTYLSARYRPGLLRPALVMVGMAVAFSIYPVSGAKFWAYHWMPFLYFLVCLSALTLAAAPPRLRWLQVVAPLCLLAVAALRVDLPPQFATQLAGQPYAKPTIGQRAEEVAAFLTPRLRPGDRVQPLDSNVGVLHGMLLADALPATRFIYDFHFYHHLSTPYVQGLRARFIGEFSAAKPRFVVESDYRDWYNWPEASSEFPELQSLLNRDYEVVHSAKRLRIYERVRAE